MSLSLVTPPVAEPVVLAEALDHLRLGQDAWDSGVVATLIQPAREYVEAYTARQLMAATWTVTFPRFPCRRAPLELPLPPLQSVTSVKYIDPAGTLQTWASNQYVVDAPQGPSAMNGRIYPALNIDYPAPACREDAVTVQFVAGYTDAASVPKGIRQALLLMLGHLYENREAVVVGGGASVVTVPLAVESLLEPFCRLSEAVR
jgi:uncharacterized phiE125 gp8 family phage protein